MHDEQEAAYQRYLTVVGSKPVSMSIEMFEHPDGIMWREITEVAVAASDPEIHVYEELTLLRSSGSSDHGQDLYLATKQILDVFPSSFLLECLIPPAKSIDFLANFENIYQDRYVPRFGPHLAKVIWHIQCARMVFEHWKTTIFEAAKIYLYPRI